MLEAQYCVAKTCMHPKKQKSGAVIWGVGVGEWEQGTGRWGESLLMADRVLLHGGN